jgi:FtsP/CotA-like multicopper oxidase with cupredoxin domain
MNRRTFIADVAAAIAATAVAPASRAARPQAPADVKLEIAPLDLEIAPRKIIHTVAYNGQVPGPLIRWPEGKPIAIEVTNRTSIPEIVHWHGQWISSQMDGSMEEGSRMIAPGAQLRYEFAPRPAGFRWYHTHTFAGHDLKRGTYSAQFGCFYVEPRENPGAYDQELFLTLHDWNAYMGASGDLSMEAAYPYGTVNDRMLGFGQPVKVREGQRVLFHLLNASASLTHWIALSGHEITVTAMDGNPVPTRARAQALRLAPAERIDALVTMNQPGVWVFGETREPFRKAGIGIVVEYAGQSGNAKWIDPPQTLWDYKPFASSASTAGERPPDSAGIEKPPDEVISLRFEPKFHGQGAFDSWLINGKSFPNTDVIPLRQGRRYRLRMDNHSSDDHPVHLHRHTFELMSIAGVAMQGLNKDVVVVPANSIAEVDFTANNPGATLFHCHNQTHMDFGFMTLLKYV